MVVCEAATGGANMIVPASETFLAFLAHFDKRPLIKAWHKSSSTDRSAKP